jgi:hypothetical protein
MIRNLSRAAINGMRLRGSPLIPMPNVYTSNAWRRDESMNFMSLQASRNAFGFSDKKNDKDSKDHI